MDEQKRDQEPTRPYQQQPPPLSPHYRQQPDPRYSPEPGRSPEQAPYQQPYQQAPDQYPDPRYRQPASRLPLPAWFPRDPMTLGVLAAGVVALGLCCVGFCFVLLLFTQPITPPQAPTPVAGGPTFDPQLIWTPTPAATPTPVFDPSLAGTLLNPYFSASLDGMTALALDLLDQSTGNYMRQAQIVAGSAEMAQFIEALNIAVFIRAPNPACPDHARFSITRSDGSLVVFGVCLDQAVILRGDIPGLSGGDLPMGPFFTDVMLPYLPDAYKRLLGF